MDFLEPSHIEDFVFNVRCDEKSISSKVCLPNIRQGDFSYFNITSRSYT